MDQSQSQSQSQSQPQSQETNNQIKVNPLQILVNAAFIAYQRGAFTMKETSIISQSIDFFIDTNQAIIPQLQTPSPAPTTTQNQPLETIKEDLNAEKVVFLSQ
jgi:hypothetical protein